MMSMTHLITILIGFHITYTVLVQTEGKEFLKQHTLKPLEFFSIIATVKLQFLCHLTAKVICGMKSELSPESLQQRSFTL